MGRTVAIRLGTEGKAQVKADFVEIGDTGDATAKRWSRSFDSATKDVEAALQRQSNAAAKLSMITPQSATQMRINDANSTGYGQHEGSARQSAMAFRELIAAQEQMENRANALRAAIDPAFAAQQRFDREIAEARTLISTGAITLDEYSKRHVQLQQQMNVSAKGLHNQAEASGAAKAGYQQLNFQLSDIATQFASGAPPMQIFAQQSGQLFQALGLIASGGAAAGKGVEAAASASEDSAPDIAGFGEQVTGVAEKAEGLTGKLGAVAGFMTGPWGAALLVAVSLLTPFIAKLFESNDALGDAVEKLKADAEATDTNARAKAAFAVTVEGVTAAIREQATAFDETAKAQRSSAERANIEAKQNLERIVSIRQVTLALIEQAQVLASNAKATNIFAGGPGGAQSLVAQQYAAEVGRLQSQAEEQKAAIVTAQQNVQRSRLDLAAEGARRAADPMARLNKLYDDRIAKIRQEANEAIASGRAVGAATQRKIEAIEAERKAALKAEQDRQQAASKTSQQNQVGRNVTLAEARGIAESIGGRVTSGVRSREEQQRLYDRYMAYKNGDGPWAALAAKPGTSNHETGQALDIAKSGGVTLAKLVAAYRQAGVSLSEALDEGDHYHIAFRKTGEAARAAAQDRKEATKQARDDAQAEKDLASDLKEVVGAYDPARAAAEAYADTLAKIDTLVSAGRLTIDQGNGIRMAAYHAEAKRMADESYETFKKLFGTDDPMADAVEGARRNVSNRVDQMAEQDAAKVGVVTTALDELRAYGGDFVSTVLSEQTWSSWGNAGKTILSSLKNEFISLALLNPLKNLINGDKALPTLSSAIGNIGKLFKPGTNAAGTEYWSGGMSLVGENGPEIVSMPRGSRVTTAQETRQLFANDNPSPSVTHNHFSGNLMTPEFWERINAGDAGAAMQGAAGGAAMSQAEGTRSAARRLGRFR